MDRQTIMELSGEELDMAVAEHVMGWHWEDTTEGEKGDRKLVGETVKYQGLQWLQTYHPGHHRYKFYPGKFIGDPTEMPMYSGNMIDAYLVVDKLMNKYHWRMLTPFTEDTTRFYAGVTPLGITGWNGRPDYEGYGETMPIAICRAALIAVFEDIEDANE